MTSSRTLHLHLNRFGRTSKINDDGFKFGVGDRDTIDQAIWKALAQRPGDVSAAAIDLATQLNLTLDTTSSEGTLPAGQHVYYVYTLVDAAGVESLPSPESTVTIPAAVAAPGAPLLASDMTGGALLPGTYMYALSSYVAANTYETTAPNLARILLPPTSTDWKVTLTLPALPAGADGFNVYRRRAAANDFVLIDSIDMTGMTPPTEYVDDGTATEDTLRGLPPANNTNSQASVIISIPGATPTVPVGYTWRIYRSFISGQYSNTFLHAVIEETFEGSGVITPVYTDIGLATGTGAPPTEQVSYPDVPLIQLDDGAEVEGVLPPANIVFRHVEEWTFPGTLEALDGTFAWRCPYDQAFIDWVWISLGKDSSNNGATIIVQVEKWNSAAATPSWANIFTSPARPNIPNGETDSDEFVPDVTRNLVKGDKLVVDLVQPGGAGSPTDRDLLVQVVMWYWDDTATTVTRPSL